jgi:hypothetical protein
MATEATIFLWKHRRDNLYGGEGNDTLDGGADMMPSMEETGMISSREEQRMTSPGR